MAFDSKKFLVRTGSAAVFVIVLLGCILWNYYSFSALFFIVSLWGLKEFYKLMELNGNKPNKIIGYILSISLYGFITSWIIQDSIKDEAVISVLQFFSRVLFALISIVSLLIPLVELFRNKEKPLENISITFYGVVYVVMPFILFNLVANYPLGGGYLTEGMRYQSSIVVSVFLLIWSNDTFAYLVGSFIGKNKMYERISPGKTWEGTIGGAILTVASSFLIYKWFGILELNDWIIISTIVAVLGTLGDLVESMLKRSVGVKDSGNIMPGHGGILDRFDSLIMVAPFVFLYLILK